MSSATTIANTALSIARIFMSSIGESVTRSRLVRESTFAEVPESPDTLAATQTGETGSLKSQTYNELLQQLADTRLQLKDTQRKLYEANVVYRSSVADRTNLERAVCDASNALTECKRQLRNLENDNFNIRRRAENIRMTYAPRGTISFFPYPDQDGQEGDCS